MLKVNFSTSHFLWQEAVEKSSYFEPRRLLQRGDVTEAFKTVDKVYEGKSCLRTTGRNVCFFFLNSACFLLRGDSNWRPGAFLHGDAEHAGGSRRRGDGVQRLHLHSVANFDSGKRSRCVSVNLRVTQWVMAHQCSHVEHKRQVRAAGVLDLSVQDAVAETLNIASNRVTCHVKRVGGAFGGKVTRTSVLASITSVAAWKWVQRISKSFTQAGR